MLRVWSLAGRAETAALPKSSEIITKYLVQESKPSERRFLAGSGELFPANVRVDSVEQPDRSTNALKGVGRHLAAYGLFRNSKFAGLNLDIKAELPSRRRPPALSSGSD
jgi:hypothetical protein